jgi:glyoxylase-like metal-dependent hydrolase (beta-lactamase superfamily II)
MPQDMKTICLDGTNCYLIKTTAGFILIDTGYPFHRGKLEKGLEQEGCTPGNLELILLTHGDIDHSGNAAYLREKYKANIAMHSGDTEMCLKDGFTRDRGKAPSDFPPLLYLWLIQSAFEFLFGQLFWRKPFDRFEPDMLLEEGRSLAEYGFDAKVLYTPGHSKGSVSVLTGDGNLFCGDMFGNVWGKILKSVDEAGFDRLKALNIKTIYPGHGKPFPMERLMKN